MEESNMASPFGELLKGLRKAPTTHPAASWTDIKHGTRSFMSYGELRHAVAARVASLTSKGSPLATIRMAWRPKQSVSDLVLVAAALHTHLSLMPIHPRWPDSLAESTMAKHGALTEAQLTNSAHNADSAHLRDTELAAILFTSGTSGTPKGARLSARAILNAVRASKERLSMTHEDRWGLFLPPAHIGGLSVLYRCLEVGATVVFGRSTTHIPQEVEAHGITLLSLVPTQLDLLLEAGWTPPASLRWILVGGAPLSDPLRERALDAGYPIAPTYGMTETCAQAATSLGRPGVGLPMNGVSIEIIDGEICVGGDTLFDGYLDEGEPLGGRRTKTGHFRTGDLGRIDDEGNLHVIGRSTDRIITGGENVDATFVEEALLRDPDILDAVVFGVQDKRWGELVSVVCVVNGGDSAISKRAIEAALLPDFARPRLYHTVDAKDATLALLTRPKKNRRAVRERYLAQLAKMAKG